MTEPNPVPEADAAAGPTATSAGPVATAAARMGWPALPAAAAGKDPDVESLLARLETLPGLPVSEHGEVYAGLHHDLLEALNEAGDTAT